MSGQSTASVGVTSRTSQAYCHTALARLHLPLMWNIIYVPHTGHPKHTRVSAAQTQHDALEKEKKEGMGWRRSQAIQGFRSSRNCMKT